MPVYGLNIDRENPPFSLHQFLLWMPNFKKITEEEGGAERFSYLQKIANEKILHSVFGLDWELAFSLCIGHYWSIMFENEAAPDNSSSQVKTNSNPTGIMSSMGVGNISKSIDFASVQLGTQEALFWNTSRYGQKLMTLLATKSFPSIIVVTG